MVIQIALAEDKQKILKYDKHIPLLRLEECIRSQWVYVLRDVSLGCTEAPVVGVLRYSLFWQTIPFLDLIYIDECYRGKGHGTALMTYWAEEMKHKGYDYLMTSTQADETAWEFYEKLGFRKVGHFLPPGQEAEEWIYTKEIV